MSLIEFIENNVMSLCIRTLALFCRIVPLNHRKVLFISYMGSEIPKDYKLLQNQLSKYPEIKIVSLSKSFDNTLINKLSYFFFFLLQTYHVMTSKIIILDGNNFVVSTINIREETQVIQLWHAAGAIKKFGFDYKKRRYNIRSYDYILTPSSTMITPFSQAFGVEESHILPLGIPQLDELGNLEVMNSFKQKMYERLPILKNKKVVLYAPTYRGDGVFNKNEYDFDFEYVSKQLGDQYFIIYRPHPLLPEKDFSELPNVLSVANIDLNKLFSVVDILISDYSALIYNFVILQKKIIFYTPDLDQYIEDRGLYWDYKSYVPGKVIYTLDQLVKEIKSESIQESVLKQFYEEYFDYKDSRATERIVDLILHLLKSKTEEKRNG